MRNANRDFRGVTNALETINAAATAIASAENHVPQASAPKRRWGTCWSGYWCFGSYRHKKRIGHAILVSETSAASDAPAAESSNQAPPLVLPFIAPPSSPASFLHSEPPSAAQSPVGLLSLTSVSASMYSPSGPASIFAIGPYAHEPQLVSPPVFSTFTTEPSTAPFTPPPESVHMTTPSSPEVPFAQLLNPNSQNTEGCQRFPFSSYEFQAYQLHPGSPVGQLISPSSGISGSGTSSPFRDGDIFGNLQLPEFRVEDPPKLFKLNKLYSLESGSHLGSGTVTPDATRSIPPNRFTSEIVLALHPHNSSFRSEESTDGRFSFDLASPDAVRCARKKSSELLKISETKSTHNGTETEDGDGDGAIGLVDGHYSQDGETSNVVVPEKVREDGGCTQNNHNKPPNTLGLSTNEFNFDNADGMKKTCKPLVSSDWWANEKVVGLDDGATKEWTFFPMIHPGVS